MAQLGTPATEQRPTMHTRLVLFDFDQTLSTIHLYHRLWQEIQEAPEDDVPEIPDMDLQMWALRTFFGEQAQFEGIFGGPARCQELKSELGQLAALGAKLGVVSFGFTEVVREALQRLGVAECFDQSAIIGFDHPYSQKAPQDSTKSGVVEMLRSQFGDVPADETLLVDDDVANLVQCQRKKPPTCATLWIYDRKGIQKDEWDRIRNGVAPASSPQRGGYYHPSVARKLDDAQAHVADGYFIRPGFTDIVTAAEKANQVPPWLRFESCFVVRDDSSGSGQWYVLHPSVHDAHRFDAILKKCALGSLPRAEAPPAQTTPDTTTTERSGTGVFSERRTPFLKLPSQLGHSESCPTDGNFFLDSPGQGRALVSLVSATTEEGSVRTQPAAREPLPDAAAAAEELEEGVMVGGVAVDVDLRDCLPEQRERRAHLWRRAVLGALHSAAAPAGGAPLLCIGCGALGVLTAAHVVGDLRRGAGRSPCARWRLGRQVTALGAHGQSQLRLELTAA
eukprot:TRINITY_DN14188_c0_g1_i1.p2 TRINITY_DN14188_c0_g1~~TRINITY_DN14188_c0_g1_i1.p2  ORF type:complete len:507 (+),score=135.56 TRINITY_DN14188_c0_g1_i1:181-1701(+)